jgi:cytochrome d ubiquinol oxidase subunit I
MLHSIRKGPDEAGETVAPSALSYGSRNAPLLRG